MLFEDKNETDMKHLCILAASLLCPVMLSAQTREAAVLFSGNSMDNSYLLEEKVSVTFGDDGTACICLDGKDEKSFGLEAGNPVTVEFKDAFRVTANEDPDSEGDYYATFFTSEGAYKVSMPAKAYTGTVRGDALVLATTADGLIPASEAVVLRTKQSDVVLMPSCSKDAASATNILQGSDVPMTLPTHSYALSYGQNGVGFYDFSGSELPANKAYLTLDAPVSSISLRFSFGGFTDIDDAAIDVVAPANAYNLQGQQVDENYRGIVIVNGKKIFKR